MIYLKELLKVLSTKFLTDVIRKIMPVYVGTKFAKKADDHDILQMVQLKDNKAKVYNQQILPFNKEIDKLYKKYKIKSNRGMEK